MSFHRTYVAGFSLTLCFLLPGLAVGQQPVVLKQVGGVLSLAFSPDGKFLAIGVGKAGERLVVVWDLAKGKESKRLEGHANFVKQVVWPESSQLVALCISIHSDTLGAVVATTWTLPEGKVKTKREFLDLFTIRAVSSDGKLMVTVSGNPTQFAQVWELETGKRVALLDGGTKHIMCAAFSTDNKTLFTAGINGLVKAWDGQTFQEKFSFQANGPIAALVVAPTGNRVATWSEMHRAQNGTFVARTMELWELAGGKPVRDKIIPHWLRPYAFSPDGNLLAAKSRIEHGRTAEFRDCVQLWDVRTGKVAAEMKVAHPFDPHFMAFSPDGNRLAVDTGTAKVLLFTLPLKKQGEENPPRDK